MQVRILRQIHGKYGTLRGVVTLEDRAYAEQLIKGGKAEAVKPAKKSKSKKAAE